MALNTLSPDGAVRGAKIVATLGPASVGRIEALIAAGADLFRMNFSHGGHEDHGQAYDRIREAEAAAGRPIGVLADLQGPKLRVGRMAGAGMTLRRGDGLRLDLDAAPGEAGRAPLPHPELLAASLPGHVLLLDDGRLRLEVRAVTEGAIETVVRVGGLLTDRKGVSAPDARIAVSPLTDKDRADLAFALDLGVDWVALSFVQTAEDLAEPRRLIAGRARLMAKIEKPSAVTDLAPIIEMADACMVARGDLGVEIPAEDVPIVQARIVKACRHAGKPVIVATQMLDSMVKNPAPTRAEASDVAKAVHDGADAVMLSAESAVGDYPVETVAMMARIVTRAERDDTAFHALMTAHAPEPEPTAADAILKAAAQAAETVGAAAIVAYSKSGSTALRAARERPHAPVLGLTPDLTVARRLTLSWGVTPALSEDATDFDAMIRIAGAMAKARGLANAGDTIVVTAGIPFGTPGTTNVLRIVRVA